MQWDGGEVIGETSFEVAEITGSKGQYTLLCIHMLLIEFWSPIRSYGPLQDLQSQLHVSFATSNHVNKLRNSQPPTCNYRIISNNLYIFPAKDANFCTLIRPYK